MLFLASFPRFARLTLISTASLVAWLAVALPALAETADRADKETIISAKAMQSDQATGIVTATGKVEIARGGYVLHADKVTYDQRNNLMHAEGHVAMLTPSGEVEFSDAEDVTGDMKQAFAQNVGILFPDNSRLAAQNIQRYDGRYIVADQGSYTSCNVCKENPDHPPLWQLRAKQIVHDNDEHEIYYHNATVDFAGVPVFYTPYMSSPDPTVDRRQGFLTPSPGYTPTLGAFVRTPYYFDIAPDKDAIVATTFSQTDNLQLSGEYRERFANGNLKVNGSITHADLVSDSGIDKGNQFRGHLFSKFLYNIDNVWRAGSDVNLVSDRSYLPRYHYGSPDGLTTRNYIEGFRGRDYAAVNNYEFQDLRPGSQSAQPIVLPQAVFSAFGEPGQTFGGRWSLEGNTLFTMRDNNGKVLAQQGPDTRRVALNGGWDRKLVSNTTGLVTDLSGLLHVDAYSADNVVDPSGNGAVYNKVAFARQFEQASATTSYPLSRHGDGYQQLLEPIVGVTLAPSFYNSVKQPIEESPTVAFDESNLFAPNRFTGYDLIEGGSRITYGLRQMITTDSGGRIDFFGGQSYAFTPNDSFTTQSGLASHQSDWVGRLGFTPTDWFDLNYGFRLDRKSLSPQQQYAALSVGAPVFRPYVNYTSGFSFGSNGVFQKIDNGTVGFTSTFAKYWNLRIEHAQGFDPDPGPRTSDASLAYSDECFNYSLTVSQSDTQNVGINSGTSVLFHFFLRNIGGLETDGATAGSFPTNLRKYE